MKNNLISVMMNAYDLADWVLGSEDTRENLAGKFNGDRELLAPVCDWYIENFKKHGAVLCDDFRSFLEKHVTVSDASEFVSSDYDADEAELWEDDDWLDLVKQDNPGASVVNLGSGLVALIK